MCTIFHDSLAKVILESNPTCISHDLMNSQNHSNASSLAMRNVRRV